MKKTPVCSQCEHMKMYGRHTSTRMECMCLHKAAVETFNRVCPRSPRMAGFICYTEVGTKVLQTKTSPKWCPMREENAPQEPEQLDLCRPCACELEAEGKILRPVRRGVDQKVNCSRCQRRRYGMTYEIDR